MGVSCSGTISSFLLLYLVCGCSGRCSFVVPYLCAQQSFVPTRKGNLDENYLLLRSVLKDLSDASSTKPEPFSMDWGLGRSQSGSRVGAGLVALDESNSHLSPGRKKRILPKYYTAQGSNVRKAERNQKARSKA